MKIRCLLGWHGPNWVMNWQGLGPYSKRVYPMYRHCPHCEKLWGGRIGDFYGSNGQIYRAIVDWEPVTRIGL